MVMGWRQEMNSDGSLKGIPELRKGEAERMLSV